MLNIHTLKLQLEAHISGYKGGEVSDEGWLPLLPGVEVVYRFGVLVTARGTRFPFWGERGLN